MDRSPGKGQTPGAFGRRQRLGPAPTTPAIGEEAAGVPGGAALAAARRWAQGCGLLPPRRGDDRAGVTRARGQPRSLALAAGQRRPTGATWPAAPCAPVSLSGNVTRAAAHAGNAGRSLHSSVRPSLHSFTPPGPASSYSVPASAPKPRTPQPSEPSVCLKPQNLPARSTSRVAGTRPPCPPWACTHAAWSSDPVPVPDTLGLANLQMSPAVTSPKGPSLGLSPGWVRGVSAARPLLPVPSPRHRTGQRGPSARHGASPGQRQGNDRPRGRRFCSAMSPNRKVTPSACSSGASQERNLKPAGQHR